MFGLHSEQFWICLIEAGSGPWRDRSQVNTFGHVTTRFPKWASLKRSTVVTRESSVNRQADTHDWKLTFPQLCWRTVTMLNIHKHFPSYLSEVHSSPSLRYFQRFVKVSAVSCAHYTSTNSIIIPSHKSGFIFTAVREKIYEARFRCMLFVTTGILNLLFWDLCELNHWFKSLQDQKSKYPNLFGWDKSKHLMYQEIAIGSLTNVKYSVPPLRMDQWIRQCLPN